MAEKDFRVRKGIIVDGTGTSSIAGSLGIGVTNPYANLTVNNNLLVSSAGDTADPKVEGILHRITNTNNDNPDMEIFFVENHGLGYGFRMGYDGANNRMRFFTHENSTSGSEVMRFNRVPAGNIWLGPSANKVMIGTTDNPKFPLHLKYTDNDTTPQGASSSGSGTVGTSAEGGGLYIENASTTDGSYAGITFRTDTADARIAWQSIGSNLSNEGQMSFFVDTNDSDDASPNSVFTLEEVLRLRGGSSDSDSNQAFNSAYINGRLGVGTATPATNLEVYDGSDANIRVRGNSNYATTLEITSSGCKLHMGDIDTGEDSFLTFGAYNAINNLDTTTRDFHLFGTNTTTGLYFDESAGNFGIRTTTPRALFDVTATNNPTILLNARDASYAANDKIGSLLFYNNEDSSGQTGSRIGAGVRFVATDAYGRGRLELTAGTSSPMTSYNSTEVYTDNSIARLSILTTNGYVGIGTTAPASELHVVGHIQATTKSFVINHPSKEGMTLRHGSLEGPEHAVYIRGVLKTKDSTEGFIELPDYWLELVDEDTITVQLTGKGRFQRLYVVKIEDNKVYVENEKMHSINCYYFIQAERKDVERMVVEY